MLNAKNYALPTCLKISYSPHILIRLNKPKRLKLLLTIRSIMLRETAMKQFNLTIGICVLFTK